MAVNMVFNLNALCDRCDKEFELEYLLDLSKAAQKKAFTPKWFKSLESEARHVAIDDGWAFMGGRAICPECIEGIEGGKLDATSSGLDAKSLINDLRLAHRMAKK